MNLSKTEDNIFMFPQGMLGYMTEDNALIEILEQMAERASMQIFYGELLASGIDSLDYIDNEKYSLEAERRIRELATYCYCRNEGILKECYFDYINEYNVKFKSFNDFLMVFYYDEVSYEFSLYVDRNKQWIDYE